MYTFSHVRAALGSSEPRPNPKPQILDQFYVGYISAGDVDWLDGFITEIEVQNENVNLEDMVGQTFGRITVKKVKVKDDKVIFHLYQPPTFTNEHEGRYHTCRFTQGITVKLVYTKVSSSQFGVEVRRRKSEIRNYGAGGYYHLSEKGCLGSYVETLIAVADNNMPLHFAFNSVGQFLLHRNKNDMAGRWMRYGRGIGERLDEHKGNIFIRLHDYLESTGLEFEDVVETWGNCNTDYFISENLKEFNEWKERNGLDKKQHTEG